MDPNYTDEDKLTVFIVIINECETLTRIRRQVSQPCQTPPAADVFPIGYNIKIKNGGHQINDTTRTSHYCTSLLTVLIVVTHKRCHSN